MQKAPVNDARDQGFFMAVAELASSKSTSGAHSSTYLARPLSVSPRVWDTSHLPNGCGQGSLQHFFIAILLVLGGFSALPAGADEFDAFNVRVGGTVTHDSNLFRVPESGGPQSDTIVTGYVGLRVDKAYAQQRFQLDVSETAYRYDNFSYLNFNGLGYRGAWLWHVTPRVSGILSFDHSESLVAFSDSFGTSRNVRTTENRVFTMDGWISGGWHGLLGVAQSDQESEQPSPSSPDFRSVSAEGGIKYLALTGSSLALVHRLTEGEYRNDTVFGPAVSVVNDDYRQDDTELQANWIVSARSNLMGRLTWVDRRYDNFTEGDFSGLAGKVNYIWTPTAKLTLDFGALRNISAVQEPNSTYRIDDAISFAPKWQASAKIAVKARLEHVNSNYRGGLVATNGPSRSDTTNNASVGIDWSPLRGLLVGANLQELQRSSNVSAFDYHATVATISASYFF